MKIKMIEIYRTIDATISELYINDKFFCHTLEDIVRELPEDCPNTPFGNSCKCKEKVYGKTAIPAGIYHCVFSMSPKFKRMLLMPINVPHFIGIRFHSGNKPEDTDGCILVGNWSSGSWISNSRVTETAFNEKCKLAYANKENITLKVIRKNEDLTIVDKPINYLYGAGYEC